MQCGAKCFHVELEQRGEVVTIPVIARSSVQARKTVKLQFEDAEKILRIKQK